MARISDSLYDFSKSLFQSLGFGNGTAVVCLLLSLGLCLCALTGFYFPELAASLSALTQLSIGGGTFLMISLLCGLNPFGMLFGLAAGFIFASISTTVCSALMVAAPIAVGLLVLPNIIAAGAYLLGTVFYCFEAIFDSFGSKRNSSNSYGHYNYNYSNGSISGSYNNPNYRSPLPRVNQQNPNDNRAFFDRNSYPNAPGGYQPRSTIQTPTVPSYTAY